MTALVFALLAQLLGTSCALDVVFRVDTGFAIGTGHLARSLQLATALKRLSWLWNGEAIPQPGAFHVRSAEVGKQFMRLSEQIENGIGLDGFSGELLSGLGWHRGPRP